MTQEKWHTLSKFDRAMLIAQAKTNPNDDPAIDRAITAVQDAYHSQPETIAHSDHAAASLPEDVAAMCGRRGW